MDKEKDMEPFLKIPKKEMENLSEDESLLSEEKLDFQKSPQDPFVQRKLLVLFSLVPAVIYLFLSRNIFEALALYFVCVTSLDFVNFYVLKLKQNLDPANLRIFQPVTPEQVHTYFETRRWIRFWSLVVAFLTGSILLLLHKEYYMEIFCGSYILSTWLGIGYIRLLKIPRPKLFRRDVQYDISESQSSVGYTAAEWAASRAGWKTFGPFRG